MLVKFKKLHSAAKVPQKGREGDCAYDLFSVEQYRIKPFERVKIDTGIALEIPPGFYGQICERSGLAINKGLKVGGGIIDESFRGPLQVIVFNFGVTEYIQQLSQKTNADPYNAIFGQLFGDVGEILINENDKIAQIIFKRYENVEFVEVNQLSDSNRGSAGFGSSDKL